jgi:hypothetical protein
MIRQTAPLIAALSLAACLDGRNPLTDPGGAGSDLPGTENPTRRTPIERYEAEDGKGNGYAQSITYDPIANTFTVDNLAFDGDNTYSPDGAVPVLNGFRIYENDATYADDVTGAPINQFPHRAMIAEGTSGGTRVAIVRTGAYVGYGFGGFMYSRDGGVTLPEEGQAYFAGDYAGIRDFNGKGGLEYVTGTATAAIDFDDFNAGNGVRIVITNRKVWNQLGVDITAALVTAFASPFQVTYPDLLPVVGPGVMNDAGELSGGMFSTYVDAAGAVQSYETGKYYGLLAGEGADMELVGVIVVEGNDFRDDTPFRETGGFVMDR